MSSPEADMKKTNYLNEESIHLQKSSELEVLKIEKAQTDEMNQEILGQISMLKEALSTF